MGAVFASTHLAPSLFPPPRYQQCRRWRPLHQPGPRSKEGTEQLQADPGMVTCKWQINLCPFKPLRFGEHLSTQRNLLYSNSHRRGPCTPLSICNLGRKRSCIGAPCVVTWEQQYGRGDMAELGVGGAKSWVFFGPRSDGKCWSQIFVEKYLQGNTGCVCSRKRGQ